MNSDNRNLLLAIALSVAVIAAWQFLVIQPQTEAQRARLAAETAAATDGTPAPVPSASTLTPVVRIPREEALKEQGPRVRIENGKLGGSLRLKGARIDDLTLHGYRETVEPGSAEIVLLAPQETEHPYYAEFGWTPVAGANVALPGVDTTWTAQSPTLTPDTPVVLAWENGQGLTFRREIRLDADYMFTVTDSVTNAGGAPVQLHPYALVSRHGTPQGQFYWVLHEGMLGVFDETLKEVDYDELQEEREIRVTSTGGWLGVTDKYWMAAVAPAQDAAIRASFTNRKESGFDIYQTDYIHAEPLSVAPGASVSATHYFFAGAKVVSIVDRYAGEAGLGIKRFDLAVDWGWFFIITKPIFLALDWLYHLVGNFGVAILILTVLIKLAFFPLANRSYEAMSKMKKVQPEMQRIRDQYKDDAMEQQKQLMELYRREKVNPVMGCLPIVIQIPVFFSLYKVIFVTLEMRHAPFFGWIKDLSAPDPTSIFNLFGLIPVELPHFLVLGVWPLIMGVSMWVQSKLNPPPTDPVQQRMFAIMPWLFMFLLASFPAGLVIYWTWNNALSIAQQMVIMKRTGTPIDILDNFKLPGWVKSLTGRGGAGTPGA